MILTFVCLAGMQPPFSELLVPKGGYRVIKLLEPLIGERKEWAVDTFTPAFRDKRLGKTFGDLLEGLIKSSRAGTANIGREVNRAAKLKNKIKCVDRFLGNERIDVPASLAHLVAFVISKLRRPRMYVSIDWTDCNDGLFERLMASANCCGRSLPIYWITVLKEDLANNMTETERKLLRALRQMIPAHIQVVILADRGFAKVELFRLMDKIHLDYIFRTKRDIIVKSATFNGSLDRFPAPKGTRYNFGQVAFTQEHELPVRLAVFHDVGQKDAWFLVTSLAGEAAALARQYAHRMEIEETFKDLKNVRRGWQLRGLTLSTADRQDRMMLILAVTYAWLTLAGMRVEYRGIARTYMASSTHRRVLALWRAGLMVLQKGEVVTLQVLASYMAALVYSGEGSKTAAA